jgi:hypothetical protein
MIPYKIQLLMWQTHFSGLECLAGKGGGAGVYQVAERAPLLLAPMAGWLGRPPPPPHLVEIFFFPEDEEGFSLAKAILSLLPNKTSQVSCD